jgi:hypothetical protein
VTETEGGGRALRLPPAVEIPGGYFWSLAFDPGITTGWCVFRVPKERLLKRGFIEAMRPEAGGAWNAGEFTGGDDYSVDTMLEIARLVYAEVDEESGDEWCILVEDFVVRMVQMDRSFLSPVRLAAMFRREMRFAPVLVDMRTSSDAMNIVTDGRLRDWNLYRPGSNHARDAQRHAILTCRRYSSEPAFRDLIRRGMQKGKEAA